MDGRSRNDAGIVHARSSGGRGWSRNRHIYPKQGSSRHRLRPIGLAQIGPSSGERRQGGNFCFPKLPDPIVSKPIPPLFVSIPSHQAVFLSYASQDAEAARCICTALRDAGVEVWFDQAELRGGDEWDAKIRKQIRECALFVAVISANTQARREGYFRREWNLAAQRILDMAPGTPFLLPVVIDETTQAGALVSDEFLRVQWMRLAPGEPTGELVERVSALLQPEARESRRRESDAAAAGETGGAAAGSAAMAGEQPATGIGALFRRPHIAVPLLAGSLMVAGGSVWWSMRTARLNRVHTVTLPEIARLAEAEKFPEAYALAEEAARHLPGDERLARLRERVSASVTIETDVAGAEVRFAEYSRPDPAWQTLGVTPLRGVRVPRGLKRWRISKDGYEVVERAVAPAASGSRWQITLDPVGRVPGGMVRVPAVPVRRLNLTGLDHLPTSNLGEFYLDKFEVSNREFAGFVAAGGYRRPELWQHPIVKDGRALPWEEGMREFRDATGQPGPATWEAGTYPAGKGDHPVAGVSDFVFPVESSQAPMFGWLGTPAAAKRHILFDSGHSVPRKELMTETLAWFDRHLGVVK